MRDEVYRALAERCADLVAQQEALTVEHYKEWMAELQSKEGAAAAGTRQATADAATATRVNPWEACIALADVDFDALLSVYLQCYKHHIRKHAHRHKDPAAVAGYVRRLLAGESVLDVARSVQFPPYMLMRYVVKHGDIWATNAGSGTKDCANVAAKQPRQAANKQKIRGLGAHNIDNSLIRAALQRAAEADAYFSPSADVVRLNVGLEYEYVLQHRLQALGVAFQSEDEMRDEGRSKTPDIRLIVPIAVWGPSSQGAGLRDAGGPGSSRRQHIINWIDSKAMFGDPHTHLKENLAQLQGYVHRYGPGMVIYWYDFVESLNTDPDILLCREFPSDFVSAASFEARAAAEKAFQVTHQSFKKNNDTRQNQAHGKSKNERRTSATTPATPAKTVLVLGGGWVGTRMCASLNNYWRMVTTARTTEKVAEYQSLGLSAVHFEMRDPSTWQNLPPSEEVVATILTFALDVSDKQFYQHLWSTTLNRTRPILCLGTSSSFAFEKERACVVNESCPVTGTGARGKSLVARTNGEAWAMEQGALILHLSGLCGDEIERSAGPSRGHGNPRFAGDFARKGYLRNGLKLINLVHINDINRIVKHFIQAWASLRGKVSSTRILVSSGAYASQDIVTAQGGLDPLPEKPFPDPSIIGSKIVSNSLLRSLMPPKFSFQPPMPGITPIPSAAAALGN